MCPTRPLAFQPGQPEEWRLFAERNPAFVQEIPNLYAMARAVFERDLPSTKDGLVIYGLGLLSREDFDEAIVLSANGLGFGAVKILRGMFERVATLGYLRKYPDEAFYFRIYEQIRAYKVMNEVQASSPAKASKELEQEIKAARDHVLPRLIRQCRQKGCTTAVPMISWTNLSPLDLAKEADPELRRIAFALYHKGLDETHPSFGAITARMAHVDGRFTFAQRDTKAREQADLSAALCHQLTLFNLGVQIDCFPEQLASVQPVLTEAQIRSLAIWDNHEPTEDAPL